MPFSSTLGILWDTLAIEWLFNSKVIVKDASLTWIVVKSGLDINLVEVMGRWVSGSTGGLVIGPV